MRATPCLNSSDDYENRLYTGRLAFLNDMPLLSRAVGLFVKPQRMKIKTLVEGPNEVQVAHSQHTDLNLPSLNDIEIEEGSGRFSTRELDGALAELSNVKIRELLSQPRLDVEMRLDELKRRYNILSLQIGTTVELPKLPGIDTGRAKIVNIYPSCTHVLVKYGKEDKHVAALPIAVRESDGKIIVIDDREIDTYDFENDLVNMGIPANGGGYQNLLDHVSDQDVDEKEQMRREEMLAKMARANEVLEKSKAFALKATPQFGQDVRVVIDGNPQNGKVGLFDREAGKVFVFMEPEKNDMGVWVEYEQLMSPQDLSAFQDQTAAPEANVVEINAPAAVKPTADEDDDFGDWIDQEFGNVGS